MQARAVSLPGMTFRARETRIFLYPVAAAVVVGGLAFPMVS